MNLRINYRKKVEQKITMQAHTQIVQTQTVGRLGRTAQNNRNPSHKVPLRWADHESNYAPRGQENYQAAPHTSIERDAHTRDFIDYRLQTTHTRTHTHTHTHTHLKAIRGKQGKTPHWKTPVPQKSQKHADRLRAPPPEASGCKPASI